MLACDFTKMGEEVKDISKFNPDYIHLDVMDGNFVPSISFGPAIIKSLRPLTDILFDVHLMINNPKKHIEDYINAGADIITFHIEAEEDIKGTIEKIINSGIKAGLSIKPKTSIEKLLPFLDKLYLVLIMTVEPGFGGQKFMPETIKKIELIKEHAKKINPQLLIEVDGGINDQTAMLASNAGANICVAGTWIFKADLRCNAINKIKSL